MCLYFFSERFEKISNRFKNVSEKIIGFCVRNGKLTLNGISKLMFPDLLFRNGIVSFESKHGASFILHGKGYYRENLIPAKSLRERRRLD